MLRSKMMNVLNFFTLIFVYINVLYGINSQTCESNYAPQCRKLYNQTRFPNNLSHISQEDAISGLDHYTKLIETGCAKNLPLFLCSIFIPMCTMLDEPILPCRSLCEEAKFGCEGILKRVDLPWPEQLDCRKFPKAEEGVICIGQPNLKTKTLHKVSSNKRTTVTDDEKITLQCKHAKLISIKRVNHVKKVGCNRAVSFETMQTLCNNESSCKFQLKDLAENKKQPASCDVENVGPTVIKYVCLTSEEHSIKEIEVKHGEDKNIACKSNSYHLRINKVSFAGKDCVSPLALCAVTQSCEGKPNCPLYADSYYLPTACKDRPDLKVEYYCKKNSESVIERVGYAGLELTCSSGKILVIRAEPDIPPACSNELQCFVKLLCDKKTSCILDKTSLSQCSSRKIKVQYICS
ncbi:uncharacterized protein LOC100213271 [Hydra vulgaris]|uniref:uncharacterized protein LOC100213271 n=1 Tax=Hydra vulgaris TaxID=6087 RepID=UPI001F5F66D1|nr:uncharacterized protein LOC100213271 [Hydra vulgaris]